MELRQRLDDAGLSSAPIPILLLHGWSPGPGLPGSLLACGLFTVHEVPASTVCTIATNRWALAIVALLGGALALVLHFQFRWYWSLALSLACLLAAWQLKKRAVAFCLEADIRTAAAAIARLRPAAVVGYSWGGGVASCCMERGIWRGYVYQSALYGIRTSTH